jgi:hypothetical protein
VCSARPGERELLPLQPTPYGEMLLYRALSCTIGWNDSPTWMAAYTQAATVMRVDGQHFVMQDEPSAGSVRSSPRALSHRLFGL